MTDTREQEIVEELQTIVDTFIPTQGEEVLTIFSLISRYNSTGHNEELIGGDWVETKGLILPK